VPCYGSSLPPSAAWRPSRVSAARFASTRASRLEAVDAELARVRSLRRARSLRSGGEVTSAEGLAAAGGRLRPPYSARRSATAAAYSRRRAGQIVGLPWSANTSESGSSNFHSSLPHRPGAPPWASLTPSSACGGLIVPVAAVGGRPSSSCRPSARSAQTTAGPTMPIARFHVTTMFAPAPRECGGRAGLNGNVSAGERRVDLDVEAPRDPRGVCVYVPFRRSTAGGGPGRWMLPFDTISTNGDWSAALCHCSLERLEPAGCQTGDFCDPGSRDRVGPDELPAVQLEPLTASLEPRLLP